MRLETAIAWRFALLAAVACVLTSGCTSGGITSSTGDYVDDIVITDRVLAALGSHKGTDDGPINVRTVKGTVHLTGFVATEAERVAAEAAARAVRGVAEVRNDIKVKPAEATGG